MNILFDNQIRVLKNKGGINRYFENLIFSLTTDYGLDNNFIYQEKKTIIKSLYEIWVTTKKGGIDLIHHTYYLPFYCWAHFGVKCVSTIHDMIPEIYKSEFFINPHLYKKTYYKKSNGIIFVSENTKKDAFRLYGSQEHCLIKLSGTHMKKYKNKKNNKKKLNQILYIGKRKGYKNSKILFDVLKNHNELQNKTSIIFFGGEKVRLIARIISKLRNENKYVTYLRGDDAELSKYIQTSAFVLSTSLYEGFSLPIAEAVNLDSICLVSDNKAHIELSTDYPNILLYDRSSAEDLFEKITRLLENKMTRESISIARTWNDVAKETLDFYRKFKMNYEPSEVINDEKK